jgi:prepilin-type N-terminal cleavage/methylation domain-containing protein
MSTRQTGFTLIEMMIVITIMGTMAALLVPGIGEFLADARQAGAAEDLVRLSRHVRARAQESGLAHLLVFGSTSDDSGGLGRIRVYEGMNNHCRQTPWPQTMTGTTANGHITVDGLDLGTYAYNSPTSGRSTATVSDQGRQVIRMQAANSTGTVDTLALCMEPSGATWEGTSTNSSTGFVFTRQIAPITITVSRAVNSEARGPDRRVVFQPGSIARFRY